jgi:hypothetical protein
MRIHIASRTPHRKRPLIIILSLAIMLLAAGCRHFPFDAYDYTFNNLTLGMAFPPDADGSQRSFSRARLAELNIKHVRIIQNWSLREPVDDAFNWQPLEDRLQWYAAQGISVLVTLDLEEFPDWTDSLAQAEKTVEFGEFVSSLLALYGDRIDVLQVGNEWNWETDTYLAGDTSFYIALNNAAYNAVQAAPPDHRPVFALGSLSIGGLRSVAFHLGLITNVWFDGTPLYSQDEITAVHPAIEAAYARVINVLSGCSFQAVDLHFYDEYWNWSLYCQAIDTCLENAGKSSSAYEVIASEFGGPQPELEGTSRTLQADRVVSYIHTLDDIGVSRAYFFKLVEGGEADHPNSFLIDSSLNTTEAYEVMRRFGAANQRY